MEDELSVSWEPPTSLRAVYCMANLPGGGRRVGVTQNLSLPIREPDS